MSDRPPAAPATSGLGHWLGFLGSGITSFVIDGGVLKLLTVLFGLPVLPSRVVSIAAAMTAGWLLHRTFTFKIATSPTLVEFLRFVGVAWSTAVVNYLLFAGILYLWPGIEPLVAVFLAGLVAMVWSYLGLRFAAFRGDAGHK
jgi:putative flippase GtrA